MSNYFFNRWKSRASQAYAWIDDDLLVSGDITAVGVFTLTGDLDVTGNIIVSGTVDGRDIAADGTQLDTNTTAIGVNAGDITTIETNYLDKTSVADNTIAGNVTLADDKVLALSASATSRTRLLNIDDGAGIAGGINSVNNGIEIQLDRVGSNFKIRNSVGTGNALAIAEDGIITGPTSVPNDITTGAVNGLVIDSTGVIDSAKNSTASKGHANFFNPNGLIGSLQTSGTDFNITNASGRVLITGAGFGIFCGAAGVTPNGNNTLALGTASARWTEVFATNGTINTSDETEKDLDVLEAEENDKVLNAVDATHIMNYQFKDAVEAKGVDNARIHYGTGAQTLKANLEAQGLDPFKYAVLCWDEWDEEVEDVFETEIVTPAKEAVIDEETGEVLEEAVEEVTKEVKVGTKVVLEAGSRYGIRYDEFYALKIAVLERRLAALEV